MRKIISLILPLLIFNLTKAQLEYNPDSLLLQHPTFKQVNINKEIDVEFDLNKEGKPIVQIAYNTSNILLDDLSIGSLKRSVSYSNYQTQIEDLKASYKYLNNGKYKNVKIKEFIESDETDDDIFHNDMKSLSYTIPNTKKGTVSNESYTRKIKDAHFTPPIYLGSFTPSKNVKLTIKYPVSFDLSIDFSNIKTDYKTTKTQSGSSILMTYEFNEIEEIKDEESTLNYSYLLPKVLIRLKKVNGVNFLNSVSDLHKYYQVWLDSVNQIKYDNLDSLVNALTEGKVTDEAKARSIFNWVQGNIKYIAFEEGDEGFVPANACDVFKNRFGDCKGMSSLTKTMLEYAGLEAYYTWIGTRSIPYSYEEFPTPSVDNHMITTLYLNGKPLFLDATDRYIPFGMPTEFIQGKQALVNKSATDFIVEKVPVMPSSQNRHIDSLFLTIEEGNIVGKGVIHFTGYFYDDFNHYIGYKNDKETKEFLDSYIEKGNNKFEIKDYTIERNLEKKDEVVIRFNFSIDDYVKSISKKKYLNLNLTKIALIPSSLEKDREYDMEKGYMSNNSFYIELTVPNDYKVDYLPSSVSYTDDYTTYSIENKVIGNKLIYNFNYKEDYILLPAKVCLEYIEKDKELRNAYNESVVLINK